MKGLMSRGRRNLENGDFVQNRKGNRPFKSLFPDSTKRLKVFGRIDALFSRLILHFIFKLIQ
jgi:hypothetical protein